MNVSVSSALPVFTQAPLTTFAVAYSAEHRQYVVRRGDLEIAPTPTPFKDEDARKRAEALAVALNRVYGV